MATYLHLALASLGSCLNKVHYYSDVTAQLSVSVEQSTRRITDSQNCVGAQDSEPYQVLFA